MELGHLSLRSPKCFFLPCFPPRKMISQRPVIRSYQHIQKKYHKSTTTATTTITSSGQISGDKTVARRSANYKPNIWDFSLLESVKGGYTEEIYAKQSKKLQEAVRYNFNDEGRISLMAECTYQYGDGYGVPDLVLFDSIALYKVLKPV